jgi:DNA processing protein
VVSDRLAIDALTLSAVRGIGPRRFLELIDSAGDPASALQAIAPARRRDAESTSAAWRARASEIGAQWVPVTSSGYPERVRRLEDPPSVLWVIGNAALLRSPTVAIVGTRRASADGRRAAWLLAERAVARGAVVVSGLAAGVDAAAHEGALRAGGTTIAVMGTGVDVPYPSAHIGLLRDVQSGGVVISEYPPGSRASAGVFPRRNRIIAALADLVIVVEAGHRSGALNTAQHAFALDVLVAAVPGTITSSETAGSNALLRDGAQVVAALEDLDVLLSMAQLRCASLPQGASAPVAHTESPVTRTTRRAAPQPPLGDLAHRLLSAVSAGPAVIDEIVLRSGADTSRALAAITELELAGLVRVGLDGVLRTAQAARLA